MQNRSRFLIVVAALTVGALPGQAQTGEDFYKGKQIRMIVGFAPGNDYDIGARLLAKYLAKHIPGNPSIIVQNMPQAASIVAANYIATQAPRDGTGIGALTRNIASQAVLGLSNLEADPQIGRAHV